MICDYNIDNLGEVPPCKPIRSTLPAVTIVMSEDGVCEAYDEFENFIGIVSEYKDGVVVIKPEE